MGVPLLSICIPTYNRCGFLREALDSVLSQIHGDLADRIEIVISDNGSTDETEAFVARTITARPDLIFRFHRFETNRGPDANIYKSVTMAEGDFIYIVSDDDVPLPGAVERLVEIAARNPEVDAITLNIQSFLHSRDNVKEIWFPHETDRVIRDRDAALELLCPLFLSVIAFRRSLIADKDYTPYDGTFLIQSYCFLDVLAVAREVYVTHETYLAQRMDNTSGWPYFDVMATNFEDWLAYARRLGFSERTLATIKSRHLKKAIFSATLSFKLSGKKSKLKPRYVDGAKRLVGAYGLRPFVTLVMLPLMMTPGPILRAARDVYKLLRPKAA